jgi:hypothetical protein
LEKKELKMSISYRRKDCFTGLITIFVLIMAAASPLSSRQEGNRQWGKARVEYDKETYEKMLATDFYVLLQGQKLTRQQFIEAISLQRSGVKLTRFDATVLTVQRDADGWVAVIHEKLEIDTPGGKVYSLWITRDGWKKVNDQWVITFSEAIGSENWQRGEKPPFPNW